MIILKSINEFSTLKKCNPDKKFDRDFISTGIASSLKALSVPNLEQFSESILVKRIVENAGGKIEVISKEGVGTTFKLYIPGSH